MAMRLAEGRDNLRHFETEHSVRVRQRRPVAPLVTFVSFSRMRPDLDALTLERSAVSSAPHCARHPEATAADTVYDRGAGAVVVRPSLHRLGRCEAIRVSGYEQAGPSGCDEESSRGEDTAAIEQDGGHVEFLLACVRFVGQFRNIRQASYCSAIATISQLEAPVNDQLQSQLRDGTLQRLVDTVSADRGGAAEVLPRCWAWNPAALDVLSLCAATAHQWIGFRSNLDRSIQKPFSQSIAPIADDPGGLAAISPVTVDGPIAAVYASCSQSSIIAKSRSRLGIC
jgi:hypothetical protein